VYSGGTVSRALVSGGAQNIVDGTAVSATIVDNGVALSSAAASRAQHDRFRRRAGPVRWP